ncbi:MAG: histidine--tRNA ligase [Candidatus Moranbacteria bacterium]|nr:histidine--tRNA ligase [Candidatus Moranbacteria bacterium]
MPQRSSKSSKTSKVGETKLAKAVVKKTSSRSGSSKKLTKGVAVTKKTSVVKPTKKRSRAEDLILLQTLRGMRDLLPGEQAYWEQVRHVVSREAREYGFSRLDLPVAEYANLFVRGIGEDTEIVRDQLYSFDSPSGERVVLRPDLTLGVARSYIQHGMNVLSRPVKLFSIGPVFRHERPKEGCYRELWQSNFEIIGEEDAVLDAQVIQLADSIVNRLGIRHLQFQINSVGSYQSQKAYRTLLGSYLQSKRHKLPQEFRDLIDTNPFAILDSSEDKCMQVAASAPQAIDHLDPESRAHFKEVLEYLDELGISYVINPHLVRGLGYYTRTVFEIWSTQDGGSTYAIGGGGRYDELIGRLGCEPTPAIGFALGLDRLVLEMKRVKARVYSEPKPRVFLAQIGVLAKRKSLKMFSDLERNGVLVAESFGRGNLKTQMRMAERRGVDVTLVLGQKEALDGTVIVKDMVSGSQETVLAEKAVNVVKKILKNTVGVKK